MSYEIMVHEISIGALLKKFNDDMGSYQDILDAIYLNAKTLAEDIQKSLRSKESLEVADKKFPQSTTPLVADPITGQYSKEIIAWSVAILTSAWTEWVFSSKSNDNAMYQIDPKYNEDPARQAAKINVKIALPYIRNSILDALNKAREIGTYKEADYNPDPIKNPANIQLRNNHKN
jgi:hypothetical protein